MSDPLAVLRAGGKRALSEALGRIEAAPDAPATLDLLDAAYRAGRARIVGLTGPPGVGKSTLTAALTRSLRAKDRTVGLVAVDPSSTRTGGALLGDRTRIDVDPDDPGVFVRSMAARDRLGGLAALATTAAVLMRAVHDVVLVETVGVGQSETAVRGLADSVVLCVQPASGDVLQFMKAGIVEIPDVALVTKADLGAPAAKAAHDLAAALALAVDRDGWKVPVLQVAAGEGRGVEELLAALERHWAWLDRDGRGDARRRAQAEGWLVEAVREGWGRHGLERATRTPGGLSLAEGESPFRRLRTLAATLDRGEART